MDFAHARNNTGPKPELRSISSIGLGLRWALTIPGTIPLRPQLEVYWGHALRDVPTPGGNLQDKGIHLQFVLATL